MARHLVTGGAGFIGSHLSEALRARGDEVRVLDCFDPYYDPAIKRATAAELSAQGIEVLEGDLRNPKDVARAVHLLGKTYASVGDYHRARRAFRHLTKLETDDPEAFVLYAAAGSPSSMCSRARS